MKKRIDMTKSGLRIEAKVKVTTDELSVSYRLDNDTGKDIYILDALYERHGNRLVMDRALVYTLIEDDLVMLVRGVLRIPHGIQVEIPEVPYARLLPAGKRSEGTICCSLPLRYNQPYDFVNRKEDVDCTRLCLRIGYVAARDFDSPPEKVNLGGETYYKVRYRQVIDVQQFIESTVQEYAISLKKRP